MSSADLPGSLGGATAPQAPLPEDDGRLARLAARFTAWAERWIPDAFVGPMAGLMQAIETNSLPPTDSAGFFIFRA